MRTWLARTGLVLLAAGASVAAGCAEERDPIDRTQPNILPKSFFVGENIQAPEDDPEFRMKAFTIGSSVSQSAYTIGEFTGVERIRWEITEDLLLARRAYQEAEGSDNRGAPKAEWGKEGADPNLKKTPSGTIVAAYRIDSHFDVRRDYNPGTGEEINVVSENTTDRPWFDRQYMRVDWSKNLVDSTTDQTRFFKGATVTPVEYNVTNPNDEDAPHFEAGNGYLDVTNKFTVEPAEIEFSWGKLKECVLTSFITGSASYDCNPQEATLRMSFSKVDPNEDFERFEDTDAWRDVVGNWGGSGDGFNQWLGPVHTSWDPQYGYTDANTKRFKTIHNTWKKSHLDGEAAVCGSNADANKDGTADECSNDVTGYVGSKGSQCDVYAKRCTIPVRDREVRTIPYVLNREAPAELLDTVDEQGNPTSRGTLEDLTHSWNQLMQVSIAYRREVECRRTGDGNRDQCHAQFFETGGPASKEMVSFGGWLIDKVKPQAVDKGKPVLSACHNPVRAYDPVEACGEPGTVTRLGDIRKNHLIYWPYESRARYGGVGGNPPDPTTGESFGATATVMGRSATRAAAQQRDIIQVAMGDTTLDEVMAGVPAQRYQDMMRNGTAAPEGMRVAKTQEELQQRLSAIDVSHLRASVGLKQSTGTSLQRAVDETMQKAKSSYDGALQSADRASYEALAGKLRGSVAEAQIADGRWMTSALGVSPSTQISPNMLDLASPLRGMDPAKVDDMRAWFQKELEAKGACFHESQYAGAGSIYLPSLAGFFKQKYGNLTAKERGEAIYRDLMKETVKGIGLHELGHSIGLRHNFASSWDAPNYQPQYWQLRTNEGQSAKACSGPRSGANDSCMGPRYLDPMTGDEQGLGAESRPGVDYFANTSTMEYQIERGGESVGLGTYDLHAMKTLYGRVLETFDEKDMPLTEQQNFGLKNFTQLQERDLVLNGRKIFSHYTQTARLMKVFDAKRDCRPATAEEKAVGGWRIVHGKVCAPPPKDHWAFEDFKSDAYPGIDITPVKWHAIDKDGKDRVRWNYRYGEQYGSGGYMHTTMMDAGADIYEITQNLTRRFDLTYPWSYFRRGDREWNSMYLPQAVASQYFNRLRSYHWQIALDLSRNPDTVNDDDGGRPYAMAQGDIFAFLARVALMPEPGAYAASDTIGSPGGKAVFDLIPNANATTEGEFSLPLGAGRYISDDFENEKGGSWEYQKYLHHAGFEVEKSLAMMQLVDARPTLFTVARENYLDGRGVKINFRNDLPEAVDRLIGGVLSEDWEAVAPYVTDLKNPETQLLDITQKAAARPAGARIVFPNIGYKQQLSMSVYAALFSRFATDMTLVNKLRIWNDGDNAPTIPGTQQVRFTDPQTGYGYVAAKFGADVVDGKTIDRGIASRMIGRANDLLLQAYVQKRDEAGKPMVDANGQPVLDTDATGRPVARGAEQELALRRYIGLLDSLRQIQRLLGDGPLGGAGEE